jgi:hypothetical protein
MLVVAASHGHWFVTPSPYLDYCLHSVILPMKNIFQLLSTLVLGVYLMLKPILGLWSLRKTHFDGLFFAIISPAGLCFTNAHTVITTPTVWEPQKLEGIIGYVMFTRCTQNHLI